LTVISDLLRRGFHSAHIAEFFAIVRDGGDLADHLGVRAALFGRGGDRES
jgi:hypothetical protein